MKFVPKIDLFVIIFPFLFELDGSLLLNRKYCTVQFLYRSALVLTTSGLHGIKKSDREAVSFIFVNVSTLCCSLLYFPLDLFRWPPLII